MIEIRREFVVDVPLTVAWRHLADVEHWPSWALHIKRAQVVPAGTLTPHTSGTFHLSHGLRSTFEMAEYNPPRSWRWVGPVLWLSVSYDHRFETIAGNRTKLIWVVEVRGVGSSTLGAAFAALYERNLDKAVPKLVDEMNSLRTP